MRSSRTFPTSGAAGEGEAGSGGPRDRLASQGAEAQAAPGERQGIALIAGYQHPPNVDAALWLVREILPLVWQHDPAIGCLLVGSRMPEELRQLSRKGVIPLGQGLDGIFDRVRLTVAPLRYGAGIKGKVIDSLAAGVPCIGTPIAAEGLDLPPLLLDCIGTTAEDPPDLPASSERPGP
jgi:O-antigen biosynthesis protein